MDSFHLITCDPAVIQTCLSASLRRLVSWTNWTFLLWMHGLGSLQALRAPVVLTFILHFYIHFCFLFLCLLLLTYVKVKVIGELYVCPDLSFD